jgi:hypothetical protein
MSEQPIMHTTMKGQLFYPDGFNVTEESLKMLFLLDGINLVWRVGPKAGTKAGATDRKEQRVMINGRFYRLGDLVTLYQTGRWPHREKKIKPPRWQVVYEQAWMCEVKGKKFPDWSYEWHKEAARRRWHQMSKEEKAAKELCRCLENKKQYARNWKKANPQRVKILFDQWRSRPGNKASINLRSRLSKIMKDTRNGGSKAFFDFIGCTTAELAKHLEANFTKRMTWDNYGTYWHVDHIIPVAAFDHKDNRQVRQCWHFTNLRPLEANKNLTKGAKITEPQMALCI